MTGKKAETISFFTLGCRANQAETDSMKETAEAKGYKVVSYKEKADIRVINSCTVTALADKKSRAAIKQAVKKKGQKVFVTGCLAVTDKSGIEGIKGIDIIFSNEEKLRFSSMLPATGCSIEPDLRSNIRANLMIQTGCNNYCSYCIVPFARGRETSMPFDKLVLDAKAMIKKGIKEIILTGINIGAFDRLSELINSISGINGLERLRLSSIEPNNITLDLLYTIAGNPKVCRAFHVPLQSGCDSVLKRMGRKYSKTDYIKLIKFIRQLMPEAAITTDIIAGFPGETDEEFEKSLSFITKVGFSRLHVFRYSKRPGTQACKMDGQIEPSVIKQRAQILIDLRGTIMKDHHTTLLGQELDVLIEQKDKKTGLLEGLTGGFVRVQVEGKSALIGSVIKVRITKAQTEFVKGDIIEAE